MARGLARVMAGVLVALLGACGGGDDTTFVPTPDSLAFTATQNGPLPPQRSVHIHINDMGLIYGSGWEGATQPGWITEPTFAMIPSGLSDFDHVYAITTTALPPGTYRTAVEMRTSKPGPFPPALVELRKVQITYTVLAP